MKNLRSFTLLLLAIAILTSSCATILGGAKKGIRVKGLPPDAKVYYNGSYIGEAPTTVQVPKSAKRGNSTITVKADNYKPTDIQLTRKWSLGYTLLDIFTGFVPLLVDVATGNIYQPIPGSVKYLLEPVENLDFKVGDKVTFYDKDLSGIIGEITFVDKDILKVKYTRKASLIEKQAKKVDEITEEKLFYFNQIKKHQ